MQKKWWVILLVSVANSFIFACYFTIFVLYSPIIAIPLALISSALLIWALSNATLRKLLISTLAFILAFVFIGLPLPFILVRPLLDNQIIPASSYFELRASEGLFLMIRALFHYIWMNTIAWVVSLYFKSREG